MYPANPRAPIPPSPGLPLGKYEIPNYVFGSLHGLHVHGPTGWGFTERQIPHPLDKYMWVLKQLLN